MTELTKKILSGQSLNPVEAGSAMEKVMSGSASPVQTAAFLTALAAKKPDAREIAAFARCLRNKSLKINLAVKPGIMPVDTCGTGGSGLGKINISTAAAFVAAAAGAMVCKHGNRSATSRSGSADVLEALGAKHPADPDQVVRCLEHTGISFIFAPFFHPAMKQVIPVRKELGFPTIFNILGPLCNPAPVTAQLMGVVDPSLLEPVASALIELGIIHGFVVCADNKMDEISLSGKTKIIEINENSSKTYFVAPEDFGLTRVSLPELSAKTPAENADILRRVFSGQPGPAADIISLNAGFVLCACNLAGYPAEGVKTAQNIISSGRALDKLEQYIAFTTSL